MRAGTGAAVFITQRDVVARRKPFDGLGEGEVVELHDERDDVTAIPATETVKGTYAGPNREGRALLVVERAEALEVAAACVAQRDVVTDDLGDVGPFLDEHNVLVTDPACHEPSLCVASDRLTAVVPITVPRSRLPVKKGFVAAASMRDWPLS